MTDVLDAEPALSRPSPPPLLAPDRARAAIEAEIGRRRPVAVARTSLALMAESALMGESHPADVADEALRASVAGILDGLAARHPGLFLAEGGTDPAAVPTREPTKRRWFARREAPVERPVAPAAPRLRRPPPAAVAIKAPRKPITIGGWPLRDVALAVGALAALAAILFVLVSPAPAAKASATTDPRPHANAVAAHMPAPDIAETGTVAPVATAIAGVPEIVGPASLRIDGKAIDLFGIEAPAGSGGDDLRAYLAGRTAECQPVPGSRAFACDVEGHDLSEVILFNGGARASAEATPALVAAEDHARAQRLGVWHR